ncbi:uncharacterized protein LOC111319106 [Stylophora pistillata]|uniref:uncharacterized protein LOC111319106 n=1 Tax=Stylophora pistillata TaxID=50429 RepID=UPI000C05657E|nr:uncharacterized protein LOC111319106 [Stylophora pistillata]
MVLLLAIFILILVIAFGLIFFRRHRSHRKQYRVTCTFEKPSSPIQTPLDPVLIQQTQSPTELTARLNLSRRESELATYETVSKCIKECEYDDIDKARRKSRSVSEDSLDVQERARNTMVSGERGIKQPPSYHDEKEENKDHVYAVLRKHRKGRASSEERALTKCPGRPQKGTSGLPVDRASSVGLEEYTKATLNETPQAGENAEQLYASFD